MITLHALAAALQTPAVGFSWTGDQMRTVLMTLLTTSAGIIVRLLYTLRDEVRDMKRDLRGNGDGEGLIKRVTRNERRLDALEDRNIAIDAVEAAEQREHPEIDRRVGLRRKRDIVHEVLDERSRRTDEHSKEEGER
jgi:hypothetical protein